MFKSDHIIWDGPLDSQKSSPASTSLSSYSYTLLKANQKILSSLKHIPCLHDLDSIVTDSILDCTS